MGVYIEGLEMPKSCGYCFALDDYGDYPVCQITKEQRGYNFPVAIKRMDNCPLVPVPPHGRLIEADALAVHKFAGAEHDISIEDGGACYRRGWNDAIEAIMENAETITGGE